MSIEQNLAIAHRFIDELWNDRQLDIADELFTDSFVTHTISHQPVLWEGQGPESMKHHIQNHWLTPVPDIHFTAHDIVADANQVAMHWSASGTQQGALFGIPPTGKVFRMLGMTISKIENGKITQNLTLLDTLGLLQQLHVLPDTGTILARMQH
jgi:steroid delta-isomerase-like uncharacterized protein